MPKLSNVFLVLRNNWKKSTFAVSLLAYGAKYAKDTYYKKQLMREYCMLASKYGDVVNPVTRPFRNITVILNPAANRRNSKALFEKYCVPLLHLAGLAVTVICTEYAGQAKEITDSIEPNTDALVIAGGDGTLSETITGLLRRVQGNQHVLKQLPLGVLPLGRSNSISTAIIGDREEVKALADSTMAIIDGSLTAVDIMKIEALDNGGDAKPVYGLVQVEWGSFRNAKADKDKYWYFGKFREYISYLFTKVGEGEWVCRYTEPCKGCNKCMEKSQPSRRWWSFFLPNTTKPDFDYSNVVNEDCGKILEKEMSAIEIAVKTTTVADSSESDAPHVVLSFIPGRMKWTNFVIEGWGRLSGKKSHPVEKAEVRELHLLPKNEVDNDWLSIDNENFEVRPMKISVLPKAVNIFQPKVASYIQ